MGMQLTHPQNAADNALIATTLRVGLNDRTDIASVTTTQRLKDIKFFKEHKVKNLRLPTANQGIIGEATSKDFLLVRFYKTLTKYNMAVSSKISTQVPSVQELLDHNQWPLAAALKKAGITNPYDLVHTNSDGEILRPLSIDQIKLRHKFTFTSSIDHKFGEKTKTPPSLFSLKLGGT